MSRKFFVFLFLLISFALFLTTPKIILFYDGPEYLQIISNHTFLVSIGMGHPPIHPVFIGFVWIGTHFLSRLGASLEYAANLTVYFSGLISIVLFYKLARLLLKEKISYLATILFSFFPAVWIINTNLMVESFTLTLFLLTAVLFIRAFIAPSKLNMVFYSVAAFLLVGAHIQGIFWLLSLFALPFLFPDKTGMNKPAFGRLLWTNIVGICFSIAFYAGIFYFSGRETIPSLRQMFFGKAFAEFYVFENVIRALLLSLRNLGLSVMRGFGAFTPFLFLYIVARERKNKLFLLGILIFGISLFISGTVWTGDFMIRRVVFAGVIFALVLANYFQRKSALAIIYLLPILLSNSLLYLKTRTDIPLALMKKAEATLPTGGVLIQTHYLAPFTYNYDGDKFWVGGDDLAKVDYFLENRRVFIDSQAVFAPYLLYVGNNLHITSLGKFGKSESEDLFVNYTVDLVGVQNAGKRIYFYELTNTNLTYEERIRLNKESVSDEANLIIGKAKKGTPVFVYSRKISGRLRRERVDYGDMALWMWAFLTGRKEPMVWTYADKQGVFVMPVSSKEVKDIYVTGEQVEAFQIL